MITAYSSPAIHHARQLCPTRSARALGGEVAFVAGPSGAGVALQTWPLDREETK